MDILKRIEDLKDTACFYVDAIGYWRQENKGDMVAECMEALEDTINLLLKLEADYEHI